MALVFTYLLALTKYQQKYWKGEVFVSAHTLRVQSIKARKDLRQERKVTLYSQLRSREQ